MTFQKIKTAGDLNTLEEKMKLWKENSNLRKNIYNESVNEGQHLKTFENTQQEMFKPIVKTQQAIVSAIEQNKPIFPMIPFQNQIKSLKDESFESYAETDSENDSEYESSSEKEMLGLLAQKYLTFYTQKGNLVDKQYGIYSSEHDKFIGDSKIKFLKDDIKILKTGKIIIGTPGVWELLVKKNPTNYTDTDLNIYKSILINTNAIHRDNHPSNKSPKENRTDKWKNIIKPIWNEKKGGSLDRFTLLYNSYKAGNTSKSIKKEMKDILKDMKTEKIINSKQLEEIINDIYNE